MNLDIASSRATALICSALSIALSLSGNSYAGVLSFEKTPGGATPVDNALLSSPYTVDGVDISFSVDTNGGSPTGLVFEHVGEDGEGPNGVFTGFTKGEGATKVGDEAEAGFEGQLGDWFVRFEDGRTRHTLIVDYTTTELVSGASGEIWDIDAHIGNGNFGAEQWQVDAFDGNGDPLGSLQSPVGIVTGDPGSLDAKPWTFRFKDLSTANGGIRKIEISYIGNNDIGDTVGLAFNNFSPVVAIPEPASLALCGLGALAALGVRGSRKN